MKKLFALAILCIGMQTSWAQVNYIHRSWDGTKVVEEEKRSPDYHSFDLAGYGSEDGAIIYGGNWYWVSGDVTKKIITVIGDAHIVLCDGATLKATFVLYEPDGGTWPSASISIYCQRGGTGKLIANARSLGVDGAGINNHFGSVNIYGGNVTAYGAKYCAGIGGGDGEGGGTVTIYGGTVDCDGGVDAAGIGGGEDGSGGTVTIYGGTVHADGTDWGAGIGGGEDANGADVKIYGGIVTASAGADAGSKNGCAIGSEDGDGHRGSLYIAQNMMVHAGQDAGDAANHLFTAAERVSACFFRPYTRIEPCTHQGATYTSTGGTAADSHSRNCTYCTASEPEKHTFNSSNVCTVCGANGQVNTISIYLPEAVDGSYTDGHYATTPRVQQVIAKSTVTLPTPPVKSLPNGVTFVGWFLGTPSELPTQSYWRGDEQVLAAGSSYTVNSNISLTARYGGLAIELLDDADNWMTILQNDGMTAQTVTLSGRTLYMDGSWNTLCLPFDMRDDQVAADLAGAELMTLSESSFDKETGSLTITFAPASAIEAGVPCLVRWPSGSGTIDSPVFNSVVISKAQPTSVSDCVDFIGTFSPTNIYEADDKTRLYLGDDNTLYYPTTDNFNINAFRAYFQLKNGLMAGEPGSADTPARIVLNFFDEQSGEAERGDDTDGIAEAEANASFFTLHSSLSAWYTLDGRRLSAKPTQKGVYVRSTSGRLQGKNNGKKVIFR